MSSGPTNVDLALVLGPELFGSTLITDGDAFFSRRETPFELLFGAHYRPIDDLRVGAGVGPGLTRGFGAPQFRGVLSVEWAPQPAKPPLVLRPPPEPGDRDKDGILDVDDACPQEPGVTSDDPKKHGCPRPDTDKDGVFDDEDACVDERGPRSDDPRTNGCPPPKDTDKDTVIDPEDACPETPGPTNADPKKNGCPAARVEQGQIKILERVEFENNSAKLRPESDTILKAVLAVMTEQANSSPTAQHRLIRAHGEFS